MFKLSSDHNNPNLFNNTHILVFSCSSIFLVLLIVCQALMSTFLSSGLILSLVIITFGYGIFLGMLRMKLLLFLIG